MEIKVAKTTSNYRLLRVSCLENLASIAQLLQECLFTAFTTGLNSTSALSKRNLMTANVVNHVELVPQMIPVRRLSADTGVLYQSAIALRLASPLQLNALDIAHDLVNALPNLSLDITHPIYLDFRVEVEFPGWINIRLNEQGVATWLQQLLQVSSLRYREDREEIKIERNNQKELSVKLHKEAESSTNLFPLQYTHARCCSLLRLGHQQGLIQLQEIDFTSLNWQRVEPNPIPWLQEDSDAHTGEMQLRLVHPAERELLAQLLDVQDELSTLEPLKLLKRGSSLSQACEIFYRECRIWGEVKRDNPKLAQARLGLVGGTQVVLRSLLQDRLQVLAPVEL